MIDKTKIKPIETAIKNFNLKANFDGMTPESLKWFREYVTKNLARSNHRLAMATGTQTLQPKPGFLYAYMYDPKYKDTLPYYDTCPLILCLDVYKDGWLGINMHYMPPKIRQIMFEQLLDTLNKPSFDEKTKFKINWAKLKHFAKHKFIAHGCKRYLTSHLVTPLSKIDPKYWEIVIYLPTARFEKATIREVWRDA